MILLFLLLTAAGARASGTWTSLTTAPPTGVNAALLLSDGTVFTDDGSGDCNRLTPDIHGSYINGTWTRLTPMNDSRMFFATELLTNGNIFVAGGEYGAGTEHAELFDPLRNTWTRIPDPVPSAAFSDCISAMLATGNVLIPPVGQFGGVLIYNVGGNNWQVAASTGNQNETAWVKMTNDCILALDTGTQTAVHYVQSSNQWITDNPVAVPIYGVGAELGPGFLLPNGNVFYIGGNTNTAIYTPGPTPTSAGTWVAGPQMVFGTNQDGAVDAPAAMMANGIILCAIGPDTGFDGPVNFYEYDYNANAFTSVSSPTGGTNYNNSAPFGTSMLDLPDGSVLFIGGQNSTSLYIYTPNGAPLPQGQPAINSITENTDGSYHLVGTNLNGISMGAAYGDDEQMNSNYPLVRMTNNATGNVYYARTYNWNNTGVQTGSKIVTTEFTLPQGLPSGTYSLVAVANGNPSVPATFTYSPPSVPTGLSATSGNFGLSALHWSTSSGATAYNVKRATTVTGYYATIATVTTTGYTNTGLTNGLEYFYKVAAVGSGGPSSDSAAVGAKPAGTSIIPGATAVNLSPYYNRTGIYTDGRTFSAGFDGGSSGYSATLEPSVLWNNLVFNFGQSNVADVVYCAGQTITLPAGKFNSLQILASGVNGSQQSQTFTVTYTDSSTATFTQSFSDWANASSFPGETTVINMNYRVTSGGGQQTLKMTVDGYVFTLDQTKTVQSITLPSNSNLVLLSMMLANDPVPVSLASYYNRAGIYTDGTTFTNPATGGADGLGSAYSGTLMGSSQTISNVLYTFGQYNQNDVVSCGSQTISLPPGNYSQLRLIAGAVNGNQASQSFVVTFSDLTTSNYTQSFSDWFSPSANSGESKAIIMSHRDRSDGSTDVRTFYLYGYTFTLNGAKTVQSIQMPNDGNVLVAAMTLVPNWPPAFKLTPFTLPSANAGNSYLVNFATNASDFNGDAITFGKVSGPAWLGVANNGAAFGTPGSSDANTETFVVSARDPSGASNTATMFIYVNGAPSFVVNPFSPPAITAGQSYSGTIATNGTDPNPGDTLTYAKTGGPAWLSVGGDGTLSGTPLSSDSGTNSFGVSITDQGGLSGTATMTITVNPAPAIVPGLSYQGGSLWLNWSGGIAPYQVQTTTDLVYGVWQNIGTISSNSLLVIPSNDASFYRIVGN